MEIKGSTFNTGPKHKDLMTHFSDLCNEFKRDAVDGSIELHFHEGSILKIFSRRLFK